MNLFISTYNNKVDSKGRVSVPSQFRDVLKRKDMQSIVVYKSFTNNCVEGAGQDYIENLYQSIDSMQEFSEEKEALSVSIFGDCQSLPFDADGRIVMPRTLIEEIGIKDTATFVGIGKTFQIWEPESYKMYLSEARKLAESKRGSLILRKA